MNAKQKWILGAAAFVLLLVIAGFGYQELQKEAKRQERSQTGKQIQTEEQTQTEEKRGTEDLSEETKEKKAASQEKEKEVTEYAKAPDFIMWDQQGDQTSLQEILEGKPAVINFWTSKCPPCKEEMPDFEELYQEIKDQVQFIMVDGVGCMGETEESGRAYVEEQGFTFPVYYDLEMDGVLNYGVRAFPTTYILNGEGRVVTGGSGMITKETLQELLEQVMEP
ncbi:MAG TPA: TlpA family protein disulfide reductase [Candidatus Blautia avicola]|uniref:TlpA family protein disulfide reductase n=1 Tax=Candidatus Blautia avicola TaxID=2838483 RepID=A0A9D2QX69_9FIRM|nr:TlpA family protein disulfide reductase [Candidatus Blautia avicola]